VRKGSVTRYSIDKGMNMTAAIVADIHKADCSWVSDLIEEEKPDMVLAPGDFGGSHICGEGRIEKVFPEPESVLEFLERARKVAPVFVSRGNNDFCWDGWDFAKLAQMGITVLENSWVEFQGMHIGGLVPPMSKAERTIGIPDRKWIEEFSNLEGVKLLLCHQPEFYERYIKDLDVDIIVSGHAHGGQIRIGDRGLYARGQGWFPKYTSGVFDDRLVISRGIGNNALIPRVNNRPELVLLRI